MPTQIHIYGVIKKIQIWVKFNNKKISNQNKNSTKYMMITFKLPAVNIPNKTKFPNNLKKSVQKKISTTATKNTKDICLHSIIRFKTITTINPTPLLIPLKTFKITILILYNIKISQKTIINKVNTIWKIKHLEWKIWIINIIIYIKMQKVYLKTINNNPNTIDKKI